MIKQRRNLCDQFSCSKCHTEGNQAAHWTVTQGRKAKDEVFLEGCFSIEFCNNLHTDLIRYYCRLILVNIIHTLFGKKKLKPNN